MSAAQSYGEGVEVPLLNISRADLEQLGPADVAFYSAAWREFERRVRVVEERVGRRFLHCGDGGGLAPG